MVWWYLSVPLVHQGLTLHDDEHQNEDVQWWELVEGEAIKRNDKWNVIKKCLDFGVSKLLSATSWITPYLSSSVLGYWKTHKCQMFKMLLSSVYIVVCQFKFLRFSAWILEDTVINNENINSIHKEKRKSFQIKPVLCQRINM